MELPQPSTEANISESNDLIYEQESSSSESNNLAIGIDEIKSNSGIIDYTNKSIPDKPPILKKQYTILEEEKAPLPYKEDSFISKLYYYFKTLFVSNPRLFTLWLLWNNVGPRILVIIDLITDIGVVVQLYGKKHIGLFSLSCIFLSFPFTIVWIASLRFLQRFITSNKKKSNWFYKYLIKENNNNKNNKFMAGLMNTLLLLYLFPPIGCVVVTIYELCFVFYDVINGIFCFIFGKIMIIDKNDEIQSFKKFRKAIELFGETLPQVMYYILYYMLYFCVNN